MFFTKREPLDSPVNHGPTVAVVTWFLTVASVLCVLTRVGTKLATSRKVALEDYMIFIALVRGLNGMELCQSSANYIFRLSASANALPCPYRRTMDLASTLRLCLLLR